MSNSPAVTFFSVCFQLWCQHPACPLASPGRVPAIEHIRRKAVIPSSRRVKGGFSALFYHPSFMGVWMYIWIKTNTKLQREARRCRCAPAMVTDQLCVPGPGNSHAGPYCPISQREITVPVLWTLRGILRITGTLQNCSGKD